VNLEVIVCLTALFNQLHLGISSIFAFNHRSFEDWHHVIHINISQELQRFRQCILFYQVIDFMFDCIDVLLLRLRIVNVRTMMRSLTGSGIRLAVHLINRRCQIIVICHCLKFRLLSRKFTRFPFLFHFLVCFDTENLRNQLKWRADTYNCYNGNDLYSRSEHSMIISRNLKRETKGNCTSDETSKVDKNPLIPLKRQFLTACTQVYQEQWDAYRENTANENGDQDCGGETCANEIFLYRECC